MDDERRRLTQRLHELGVALDRTPDDDFRSRYQLASERDRVRDELSRLPRPPDDRTREELLTELAALDAAIRGLEDQRIDLVQQAGGGSMGGDMGNLGAVKLNRQMDEASGMNDLRTRRAAIAALLEATDSE